MRGFDVEAPEFSLYDSHFIEASAGTGKTFTLEQLVLRFLQDPNGPQIDELLVVTFTRAAVAELKSRIRTRIEGTLLKEQEWEKKRKLQRALLLFDEAKIFTIHSFCFRSLYEHAAETGFPLHREDESLALEAGYEAAKDFLRIKLKVEEITLQQLELVLRHYQNDIDLLVSQLLQYAMRRTPIVGGRSFSEVRQEILSELTKLKQKLQIEPTLLLGDLLLQAPLYKGFCDRSKKIKTEHVQAIQDFVSLFTCEEGSLLYSPLVKMVPENRIARHAEVKLTYPSFLEEACVTLIPLLREISDPFSIFKFLVEQFRLYLEISLEKKDLFFFDDILKLMEKNVLNRPNFADEIRKSYRAVLIDEFQDTDATQWAIFSTLFLSEKFQGPLYLVGDPKQSIYSFRGADVYTYLGVKQKFLGAKVVQLNCNFRSNPALLHALNSLFSTAFSFPLPKTDAKMEYTPLHSGKQSEEKWDDGRGSVHFCTAANEEQLFSFIYNEINRLRSESHLLLKECAVLVKDRYQGDRFVQKAPFPTLMRRKENLSASTGFYLLQTLFQSAQNIHDRGSVALVLGGPLFRVNLDDNIDEMYDFFAWAAALLRSEGILPFFNAIMSRSLLRDEKIYLDMLEIIEKLLHKNPNPSDILSELSCLKHENESSDSAPLSNFSNDRDAVIVMTTHASKGLEFEVVFPVGMALDPPDKRNLILENGKFVESPRAKPEEKAELLRQLYVSFTRAKKRVYAPFLPTEKHSPMHDFLQGRSLEQLAALSPEITFSSCEGKSTLPLVPPSLTLYPPPRVSFGHVSVPILSYSSLVREEQPLLEEFTHSEKIPASAEVGILLHELFEKLPFHCALGTGENGRLVHEHLKGTVLEEHEKEVCALISKTLSFPLSTQRGAFALTDVDPKKMIKEMEFLYPSEEENCYYTGFVDLFFEHAGSYFLLDWKSNMLNDYSSSSLHEAMKQHHYLLQAQIYQKAAERYLKLFGKEDTFGGIFYFFIRGPEIVYIKNG